MTAATTDHKNSLFKKMNLRKSMRNHKKNSAATIVPSDSTGTVEPELVSRRVVKATAPPVGDVNPAVSTTTTTTPSEDNDQENIEDHNNKGGDIALRSVQDETLREKTEQWRQERLDASAAIRKEKKEKEVKSHREGTIGTSKSSESLNNNGITTVSTEPVEDLPAVLTVASEFPEHKRKIRTKGGRDDHDGGKKSRVDDGGMNTSSCCVKDTEAAVTTAIDDDAANVKEEEKDWKATAINVIKQSATPAAIVAVVAIVAMSLFRSKR